MSVGKNSEGIVVRFIDKKVYESREVVQNFCGRNGFSVMHSVMTVQ